MLSRPFHPDLIINMDESGFISRSSKADLQKLRFSSEFENGPAILRETGYKPCDSRRGSPILGLQSAPIAPLYESSPPDEIDRSYVAGEFCYAMAPKGYLTGDVLNLWVKKVLVPYVHEIRVRVGNDVTTVLILDGIRSRNTLYTRQMFEAHAIHVIELPAYITHLYRPLDLCTFVVMKNDYPTLGEIRTDFEEKVSKKIERILKAWWRACFHRNILSAWKNAGFVHTFQNGALAAISMNRTFMNTKIS
jgi:hypothetical protein